MVPMPTYPGLIAVKRFLAFSYRAYYSATTTLSAPLLLEYGAAVEISTGLIRSGCAILVDRCINLLLLASGKEWDGII